MSRGIAVLVACILIVALSHTARGENPLLGEDEQLAARYEQSVRASNELIDRANLDASVILLSAHALRADDAQCALCILDSELVARLAAFEAFVATAETEAKESALAEMEAIRAYLRRYPFVGSQCTGQCAAP